jgi:pimeloyl-ACP methyl ester carboxylesterase
MEFGRQADYGDRLVAAVAADHPGDAVALFFTDDVGMPAEFVAGMREAPFWPAMEGRAQALVYDVAIMGGFRVPAHRLAKVDVPTLVIDGATRPWTSRSTDASAAPGSKRRTLEGQPHDVDPAAIAPVLVEFFAA